MVKKKKLNKIKKIEKDKRCIACLLPSKIVSEFEIKKRSIIYFNLLNDFNLSKGLCKKCFSYTYELYKKDRPKFINWLIEYNNNLYGISNKFFEDLLKEFNVTEKLLAENPEEYLDNLTSYAIYLQTLLDIRIKRNVSSKDEENISS